MAVLAGMDKHKWELKARFRRHAFGWRSQPAIQRVEEAVAEIKSVARRIRCSRRTAAVALIEGLSPALEHVDLLTTARRISRSQGG